MPRRDAPGQLCFGNRISQLKNRRIVPNFALKLAFCGKSAFSHRRPHCRSGPYCLEGRDNVTDYLYVVGLWLTNPHRSPSVTLRLALTVNAGQPTQNWPVKAPTRLESSSCHPFRDRVAGCPLRGRIRDHPGPGCIVRPGAAQAHRRAAHDAGQRPFAQPPASAWNCRRLRSRPSAPALPLRRDNVEHLLLIGGPNDVVIETNIVRVAGARIPAPANEARPRAFEPQLDQAPRAPQVEPNGRPSIEAQLAAQLGSSCVAPARIRMRTRS